MNPSVERLPGTPARAVPRARAALRTRAFVAVSVAVFAAAAIPPVAAAQPLEDALADGVRTFADRVVLPAHDALATATDRLVRAAAAFERTPDAATLEAFRRERLRSAVFLARGRAFAFGPIQSLGHDVALDAPVDEAGVALTLATLDDESVEALATDRRVPSLTGLGTIAHVLGTADDPADLPPATRRYLHALARRIDVAANALLDVWRDGQGGHPAFATVLTTAGEPDNRAYLAVGHAAEEIVRGLVDTLDVLVHEELPDVAGRADALASPDGAASLALLDASVDSVSDAFDGAEVARWLELGAAGSTGASVRHALDSGSHALAMSIAAAGDPEAARAALELSAASLEEARLGLETAALPLTRDGDRSDP